ncbi:hypothetical protein NDU88_011008 [Pleurodeles waltl]|uniref:Uncharacterized protein n=1 Tax=Pleurodeles waltl TaxID=8319 RepID=A0AAV7PXF3_PLEWA|nr:hypothetical protein NDU88_011008 [Pleurodeles waltl]
MCPKRECDTMLQVQDESGLILKEPGQVMECFRRHYTDLYSSHLEYREKVVMDYLTHITVKRRTVENRALLQPEGN